MASTKHKTNGDEVRRTGKGRAVKLAKAADREFVGFPRDLFAFLGELALNNEREWFEPRKARYEDSVRSPALAFIRAMAPRLREVSPAFVAIPDKVGGSLMRPYRDVRFSADKTPYKTNVGIQFRHKAGKDVHAPGLYVHLEPGDCFVGAGLWRPDAEALAKVRAYIRAKPKRWQAVRHAPEFSAMYRLIGESLARPPRGIAPDEPHIEDLKRKDHLCIAPLSATMVTSPKVVDEVMVRLLVARDYVRILCEAVGLKP